jgi:hypothetical protein
MFLDAKELGSDLFKYGSGLAPLNKNTSLSPDQSLVVAHAAPSSLIGQAAKVRKIAPK